MIRSIDIVTRNFNVLQEKQKNLSANTENMTTPGFKYQQLIQSTLPEETMVHYADGPKQNQGLELGRFTFGNQLDQAITHGEDGGLSLTGVSTDFAVLGEGFFTIDGPNGSLYTRNGRFLLDEADQLITSDGYDVQTINGQPVITSFGDNARDLQNAGNGYFTGAGGQVSNEGSVVYQGYLETANLDITDVMVEMLQLSREFEANQKIIQAINETLQKATNEVGKV